MNTVIPKVQLAEGLLITPILNGLWQTAGGHGKIDLQKAVASVRIEYSTTHLLDVGTATKRLHNFRWCRPLWSCRRFNGNF